MLRKFAVLSVSLVALAGLTFAADDDDKSETNKIMQIINNKNSDLRKATRNAAEYKKSVDKIPKYIDELVVEAKKARAIKEPAEKAKKPLADYQKLMDSMVKSSEDMSKVVAKAGSTQVQAKEAFAAVSKTCTACHDVYKKEE